MSLAESVRVQTHHDHPDANSNTSNDVKLRGEHFFDGTWAALGYKKSVVKKHLNVTTVKENRYLCHVYISLRSVC